jgi:RHS repeat-associated protein
MSAGVQAMLYNYDQLHRIVRSRSLTFNGSAVARTSAAYDEDYTYDANGNIITLKRMNELAALQDDFNYKYYPGTNKLRSILPPTQVDTVYTGAVNSNRKLYRNITVQGNAYVPDGTDVTLHADVNVFLHPQFNKANGKSFRAYAGADGPYQYDAIGNLIADETEGVKVSWTPYGKVREVKTRNDSVVVSYRYDAAGNRVEKKVAKADTVHTTRYLRDASGNVMAIYMDTVAIEQPIYGSSRLGQYKGGRKEGQRILGKKNYELSNHLGNVLSVITDNAGMKPDSVWATVVSATDYYPFGLEMKGRTFSDTTYRYGFNGKESDKETGWQDYGMRMYDPRIARFPSPDPLTSKYPWYTPYQFAGNSPIKFIDLDGGEPKSSPADATKTLKDWASSNPKQSSRVSNVSPEKFISSVLERISNPNGISQGYGTNLCGPAALAGQTLVTNDPVGYVNFMISLYEKGSATYDNGTTKVNITPGNDVMKLVGDNGLNRFGANPNVKGSTSLSASVADQLLLFSLKDKYGAFPSYGKVTSGDLSATPGWASTTFEEFNRIASGFLGYRIASQGSTFKSSHDFTGFMDKINEYIGNGNTVYLFVNGPLLRTGDANSVQLITGTHFIRIFGIDSAKDNIEIWDYGVRRVESKSVESLKNSVYGGTVLFNPTKQN